MAEKVSRLHECATCRECWYYEPILGTDDGACHVYPPSIMTGGEDGDEVASFRPIVGAMDRSCSLFEARHKA